MKKLPTKLEKQTVLDAISEIFFKEPKDIEVFFSDVYILLKEDGWDFEKLPVMDIPENIRKENSSFDKTPHYVFINNGRKVFIGPSVMAFTYDSSKAYNGWTNYLKELSEFIKLLEKTNDKTNIEQVSLNFVDFFKEQNIYEHITLSIENDILETLYPDSTKTKQYTTEIAVDELTIAIKIENNISLNFKGSDTSIEGSIIDLHVSQNIEGDNILTLYSNMHKHAKSIFFSLLKDEFIETLKPIY